MTYGRKKFYDTGSGISPEFVKVVKAIGHHEKLYSPRGNSLGMNHGTLKGKGSIQLTSFLR